MTVFRTLHRSIIILFAVVVLSILILAHFSVSKIVAEQSRAQQQSISPAIALIVENLMQPLHIAQTLSKSQEIKALMAAEGNVDQTAIYDTLKRLHQEFGLLFFIASEPNRRQYNSDGSMHELIEGQVNWYFKYKDTEQSAIADVGKWENTHFYIDLKIFDQNGEFLGFFGTGKSLASFLEIFARYKAEYGYDFIFVDQNKQIMLSSDPLLNAQNSRFSHLSDLSWYQDLPESVRQSGALNNLLIKFDGQDALVAEVNIAPFNWTLYLLTPLQARQIEISRGFIFSIIGLLIFIFSMFVLIYHLLYYFKRDMQKKVQIDPLTKLPNRNKIALRYGEMLEQKTPVSLLLIDIDHFKRVNDTHGHNAGDQVLMQVAEVFKSELRDEDVVGRWGGEEFVILLPNTGPHQAYEAAQKLRRSLAQMSASSQSLAIKITVSVGVAYSDAPRDLKELLASADDALYQAKRDGRNLVRVQLFDAA